VVEALYPDCQYFEGPKNEPAMDGSTAALMSAFADAVHAGNANAKAIGPSFVDISNISGWTAFLAAGGGDACDAISFHAYNAVTNGDMNLGKYTIDTFLDLLDTYGLSGKDLWQTESVGVFTAVYRVYHPRRARKPMMEWMLFEQKGVPRERNNWWYDTSHGFWDFPQWISNEDGSLEPHAVLGRVMAEETWGKPFSSAVDFGTPGNNMFIGNVYSGTGGTTVALMATSFMDDASVTLNVPGSSVTVVDGFGNEASVPVVGGRITVTLTDIPSYVRLAPGASVSVAAINDWGTTDIGASVSPIATTKTVDSVNYPVIADDAYMTNYGAGTGIAPSTWATPPSLCELQWEEPQEFNRVVVWAGPAWQNSGTLLSFTIEVSTNGMSWEAVKSVTKPQPEYMYFGTNFSNAGCFIETYWDEQWVFDLGLSAAVTAVGLRVSVSEASYGGEPLSAPGFGQGNADQAFRIEEIGVFYNPVQPSSSSIEMQKIGPEAWQAVAADPGVAGAVQRQWIPGQGWRTVPADQSAGTGALERRKMPGGPWLTVAADE
jgi:hypothetical protein